MNERAHVIKKEAQPSPGPSAPDGASSPEAASPEEAASPGEEAPARSHGRRIPASAVAGRSKPAAAGEDATGDTTGEGAEARAGRRLLRGKVLRGRETRQAVRPVTIGTDTFVADVPLPGGDAPREGNAPGGGDKEASNAEGEAPQRPTAEWEARLEEAVAEARAEGREEGRQAGYETGYAEGYEEGEATARAACEERCDALAEDAARLGTLWEEHVAESTPMLVELSLQLAEALVESPLAERARRASEEAIAEAAAELAGTPPVTVTVHPVDYLRLEESGLAGRLEEMHEGLQWTADPDYAEGDWSVASPAGAVRRLRREVVQTLRQRLDLAPASEAPASEAPGDALAAGSDPASALPERDA